MTSISSNSSPFLTPPSYPNIVRQTNLTAEEGSIECHICFEHLGQSPAGAQAMPRNITVATNCACTRENQIFHEYCLANMMVRQHTVIEGGRVSILCPFGRHSVDIGDLTPIYNRVFPQQHRQEDRISHSSLSEHSDSTKKSEWVFPQSDNDSQSSTSFGSLNSKTREVRHMMENFGNGRSIHYGKLREVDLMNNEFGEPRTGPGTWRTWKIEYARRVNDRFGEPPDGEESVLLDPSIFGETLSQGNLEEEPGSPAASSETFYSL